MSHPIRRLATLQSAVFLLNSRLTHFTATYLRRHPFFRSYGARLPSCLTRFHSRAWVYSTHPPVSVYGTGALLCAGDFLGCSVEESASAVASTSPCGTRTIKTLLLSSTAYSGLNFGGAGILNLLSIVYAFRPRLRSRLTLGGRAFPRKPWVYGGQEFHLSYRYSCLHSHLLLLHRGFRPGFNAPTMLPYQRRVANHPSFQSFGMTLIANHFRRENTR